MYQKEKKEKRKTQLEETEQVSEKDMAGMVGLSDREFKTMIINMLRALMDEIDSMQEQMDSVSRDGNPKKEPKSHAGD